MRLRFLDAFQPHGEANVVIDRTMMATPQFCSLLGRLLEAARAASRDHWWRRCPLHSLHSHMRGMDGWIVSGSSAWSTQYDHHTGFCTSHECECCMLLG